MHWKRNGVPVQDGGRVIYHMGDKPHAIPLSCCNQALSYKVSKTALEVIHIKDLNVDPFWPGTGQTTCNNPGAILRTNRPRCRDKRKMERNEMLVLFGYDSDVSGNLPVQHICKKVLCIVITRCIYFWRQQGADCI